VNRGGTRAVASLHTILNSARCLEALSSLLSTGRRRRRICMEESSVSAGQDRKLVRGIAGGDRSASAAAAAVLASLLVQADLRAQGAGRIAGTVQDLAGNPVAGVVVALAGIPGLEASTDSEGRFVLEPVPIGEYVITATLADVARGTRSVRVVDRETAVVALTLSIRISDQVIVTADRTGERDLQNVPAAVTALSDRQLQQREARTIADVAGVVPSVTFAQNTGFAQLTIRGIGSNNIFTGSDPSSAVYIDGVYLARPAGVLGDFLDLARVEVLRGPQGTLYGRNAVGGAINLITKLPTNERTFSARLVLGSFQTSRAEINLSGPIVPGRIMASGSVLRGVSDGFVRDLDNPVRPLGGTDVTAARGTLRVLLNERSELRVTGDFAHRDPTPLFYSKVLAVKPGFTVDNPADLHDVRTSTPADSRHIHYGGSAQLIWRPSPGTELTSVFAARELDYRFRIDSDISELNLSVANAHEIHHQVSEELTVTSTRAGLRWTGGVFLFKDVDRQPTLSEFIASGLTARLDPTVKTGSIAAFGQATVDLGSRLSGTLGIRYSRDRKTIDNAGGSNIGDAVLSAFQYHDSSVVTAWTPKFGLEFPLHEETLAYASITRGFKSGGFNISATSAGRGFAPEWAWTYEGGVKSSVLSQRVTLNGALYFTDYTDLQVQTPIRPGVVDIANAATATIRGVEVEGQAHPATAWTVGGHLAWLDARYDRYTAVSPVGAPVDVAGRRLSNAPEWSGRMWLEYARSVGHVGALSLLVDLVRQSTVCFTPMNDEIQRQGPYGLVNANVTIRPRQHWSVGFYARNLTGTGYITGTSSVPPPAIGGRPGEPRQLGVQLNVTR
jgi:iron complex outermembrane receptor protein